MSYIDWYEKVTAKIDEEKPVELWLKSLWFGAAMVVLCLAYLLLEEGEITVDVWNKAFGDAALILIAFSFALSGLCYFWDFVDTKIVYRKYIGVVGFYFALVHLGFSLALLRQEYDFWEYYSVPQYGVSMTFAYAAMLYFFVMVVISDKFAMRELGTERWRKMLRVGYVALLFAMVHFAIRRWDIWVTWFQEFDPWLPPLSLWMIVLALGTLLLRVALWVSLKRKERNSVVSAESV